LEEVEMSLAADLLHHVPGRLRLRIAGAKANPDRLQIIQHSLEEMPGVRRVDTNPKLGSVIVQYDPALFGGFVDLATDYATQHNLFAITAEDPKPCVSETDRSVNRFLSALNRGVQAATDDAINLKELFPLALGLYGLLFVNRAAAAAQWLNWIQVAFDTYMDLHEDEPIAEVAEAIELLGEQILAQQAQSMETLRSELAALRAEIRVLSNNHPLGT
jgi:hypothetical protein